MQNLQCSKNAMLNLHQMGERKNSLEATLADSTNPHMLLKQSSSVAFCTEEDTELVVPWIHVEMNSKVGRQTLQLCADGPLKTPNSDHGPLKRLNTPNGLFLETFQKALRLPSDSSWHVRTCDEDMFNLNWFKLVFIRGLPHCN
ncbi:unnamed protein product [Lepidochelys kempii]